MNTKYSKLKQLKEQSGIYKLLKTPGYCWLLMGKFHEALNNYNYVSEAVKSFYVVRLILAPTIVASIAIGLIEIGRMISSCEVIQKISLSATHSLSMQYCVFILCLSALAAGVWFTIRITAWFWMQWSEFMDCWVDRHWDVKFLEHLAVFGWMHSPHLLKGTSTEQLTDAVPHHARLRAGQILEDRIRVIRDYERFKHVNGNTELAEITKEKLKSDLDSFKAFNMYPPDLSLSVMYNQVDKKIAAELGRMLGQ